MNYMTLITTAPLWAYRRLDNITKTSWCIIGLYILSNGLNPFEFLLFNNAFSLVLTTMTIFLFPLMLGGYLINRKLTPFRLLIAMACIAIPIALELYLYKIEFVCVGAVATWLLLVRRWNTFTIVTFGLALIIMGGNSERRNRNDNGIEDPNSLFEMENERIRNEMIDELQSK